LTPQDQLQKGDDPRYENIEYKDQQADLTIVRDVEAGEDAIKGKRHTYLPQEPKESDAAYEIRLNRSGWWDGYQKCKAALVGMVFRKPPVFAEQLAPEISAILDNIDLQGNHAAVFIKEQFAQSFDGHSFILVDMQVPLDPAVATKADEVGRRPYWCKRTKDQVVNWVTGINAKGEIVPVQATIHERIKERQGRFGEIEVNQWRVLAIEQGILVWEIWRLREGADGKQEVYLHALGTAPTIDFIPLIPIYTRRTGFWVSKPALLGLARLMILHFRGWSDLKNILHKCCVPLIVFFGREGEGVGVEFGPNAGLDMPTEGRVEWAVPDGTGIGASRQEQLDVERLAGVMGLELLAPRSDVEVTATQSAIDDSSQISDLGGMVGALDDAINQALYFTARFLGLENAGETTDSKLFTANKDFQRLKLDSGMIAQFSSMVLSGQLSVDTLFWLLGRGEMLPPNFDPKKEKVDIGEFALLNPRPDPGVDEKVDPAKAA
jgi:hypothetical protein